MPDFPIKFSLGGVSYGTIWSQFFPPKATLTEKNLPSQKGKIFIVTGGSSGIGYELSKILYGAGGKVYILTRSEKNAIQAISEIKDAFQGRDSKDVGELIFVHMDLEDLDSVRSAASEFLAKEEELHILFNNAGVASVPAHKKTKQGLEYHIGVNTVGHVLLQSLLTPILAETATNNPKDSVRAIWAASLLVEMGAPPGGVLVDQLDNPSTDINEHYSASKTANWFAATEFARRSGPQTGVVTVAVNPGTYVTNVWRTCPWYLYYPFWPLLRFPIQGAYTNMWAAFSDEVGMDDAVAGRYGMCDGRWHPGQRDDLLLALKSKDEGGTGQAKALFEWCEEKVKPYVTL
ncbi:hypothetical protein BDV96DRAFT_280987 [Lophiotrema nucula]|uniref:Short-chain dehydrogenase n=1 Tax=Lophiotrema nucula TaxID=690887 RepID=A0A6A5ZMM5_9PLEO|nr:hypothetical protein BDV96DRAFT_280987 [Lophiotrema nucula]